MVSLSHEPASGHQGGSDLENISCKCHIGVPVHPYLIFSRAIPIAEFSCIFSYVEEHVSFLYQERVARHHSANTQRASVTAFCVLSLSLFAKGLTELVHFHWSEGSLEIFWGVTRGKKKTLEACWIFKKVTARVSIRRSFNNNYLIRRIQKVVVYSPPAEIEQELLITSEILNILKLIPKSYFYVVAVVVIVVVAVFFHPKEPLHFILFLSWMWMQLYT